jgi:Zn-dependent peptidase ImmA (M78 family)
MSRSIKLNELQVEEIRKLASNERQTLGFIGDTPIANDIFTILDRLDILLLEYPIKSEGERQAFSAAIMYLEEDDKELVFIGLNTADYYDKQIFAIAHELYHYYTKTGSHLSRLEDEDENIVEAKANRFAAELLFPEVVLEGIVLKEFKTSSLVEISVQTLLRFIARLQCTWWLPYRSIVRKLNEIKAISEVQYKELYEINERERNGSYGRLGIAINSEIFRRLNRKTNNIGTSAKNIEIIIRNFEDELIDDDKFEDTLNLFMKTPDDFGYEITVSNEDLDELERFFDGDHEDED